MKQDATILVCCHKNDYFYSGDNYLPIQVGKAISDVDLNIQGDNTGNNISNKNPNYCELTAHYWYWKNCQHSKYVGLNHYRRYFDFSNKGYNHLKIKTVEQLIKNPPQLPNLDKIFKSYDIILAKPIIYPYSLDHDYCYCHINNDINILKEVISDISPEYNKAYTDIMINNNKLSPCNMFITKDYIFNDYSEWCFKILSEVENRVHISKYREQARIFGYMSERMLNIYVNKHKLRIKYLPIIKVDETNINNNQIISILKDVRAKLVFSLLNIRKPKFL